MKKYILILMLIFVGTLGTQYDTGTMTIDNIPGHQLYTTNVKFESEFDKVPQVVLSIQHVEADQIIELYSRAAEITQQGFLLQIISSSQLSNMRVNYMAVSDDQMEIICQNFQTKKGLIKIPIHNEQPSVGIFITGFSVKKDVEFQLKLDSIDGNQAVFETKQQSLGLCLIVGNDKTINQKTLITTTSDGKKMDFAVQDISDTLNIPQENPILSFDDIMNKLLVTSDSNVNDNDEYLDIDSISIESLGMNVVATDESDIQSLEIEYLKPTKEQDQIKQAQIINIEKEHIEAIKEVVQQNVNEEIKLELDEIAADKNTLAQVNQEESQQEVEIQYDIVPSTADDLDMDALYKEYTLGNELVDDLAGWTSATVVKQEIKKDTSQVDIESVDVIGDSVLSDIRVEDQKPIEQQKPEIKLDLPVFDEDISVQDIDQELEIKLQPQEPTQSDITKQELIDDYNTFVDGENQKQNEKYEQEHPLVEVDPETQQEAQEENMEDDLLGDSLKGIDFDLFFDDFYNPNQKEQTQPEEVKSEQKVAIKYEEPNAFKQPKDNYDDIMRDLRIPDKIESVEDEQELISQLKNKSIELRKKLQVQYDAVPKLEEAKKQTEYSVHNLEEQYPKLNSNPEVEYQVESKYNDWQMSQKEKIMQISQDLTEEDRKNPRFSLLQMDTKSELDIQKQINDFLQWSDASFVMIGQNLRRR